MHASDKGIDKAYKSAIGGRHKKKKLQFYFTIFKVTKETQAPGNGYGDCNSISRIMKFLTISPQRGIWIIDNLCDIFTEMRILLKLITKV